MKHLKILQLCNQALLHEAIADAEQGRLQERAVITVLEALFKFTQSRLAQQAAQKFKIDWLTVFPVALLEKTSLRRLQNFFHLRLLKVFPSSRGNKA